MHVSFQRVCQSLFAPGWDPEHARILFVTVDVCCFTVARCSTRLCLFCRLSCAPASLVHAIVDGRRPWHASSGRVKVCALNQCEVSCWLVRAFLCEGSPLHLRLVLCCCPRLLLPTLMLHRLTFRAFSQQSNISEQRNLTLIQLHPSL